MSSRLRGGLRAGASTIAPDAAVAADALTQARDARMQVARRRVHVAVATIKADSIFVRIGDAGKRQEAIQQTVDSL